MKKYLKKSYLKGWEKTRMGQSFIDRQQEIILEIGKDKFTKQKLVVEAKCGDFDAARNLNKYIQTFHPRSIQELAKRVSIDQMFGVWGIGPMSMRVWLHVLDSAGQDPEDWMNSTLQIPTIYNISRQKRR